MDNTRKLAHMECLTNVINQYSLDIFLIWTPSISNKVTNRRENQYQQYDVTGFCVCVCVCVRADMYVCIRGGPLNPALAPWPSMIYCASPLYEPFINPTPQMKCRTSNRGRHFSHLAQCRSAPGDKILNQLWPQNSSVNQNLKRCPFRWQCPVTSPTTHVTGFYNV
jgi:hypothetical protein